MFTGIVEAVGEIETLSPRAAGVRRIALSTARLSLARVRVGDSVAVNGVCLTVVRRRGRRLEADLGPETMALTTLGALAPGHRIHVERSLRVGDRLDGHLVMGHVDGVGRVLRRRRHGQAVELDVALPSRLGVFLAAKGSIAVDGVSLTVNHVRARGRDAVFSVMLIPHTLAATCLGERRAGDRVNIEIDPIARYTMRFMKGRKRRVR
jgi:riboflavin synthase